MNAPTPEQMRALADDATETGEYPLEDRWISNAQDALRAAADQVEAAEDRIRRDERMRWAIYLWGMGEDTDGPEGAFEEGADMAYHAVGAWLLANIAGSFAVSDMPWLDPDLVADAKSKARLLPTHPDSEVHEVDRCLAVLASGTTAQGGRND